MKENKRRQSLGGAVLMMVLTVMFVLIILLMATLTTVSTANQRIFTKYEENQAYYSARSALDVFTQNMASDRTYIAYNDSNAKIKYKYGNNKEADMKQGLLLQLDLYSITAQSGHNVTQKALYDYAHGISVPDDEKDEYENYFGTKPGSTPSASAGPDINEIYYEVQLPKLENGASQYGKLSDRVTRDGKDVNVAKIKVEILERKYNIGEYTDGADKKTVPDAERDDFFAKAGSYTGVTDTQIAEAVANGDRQKDTMKIKITSYTEFDGIEGIAVLILDSNEPPVNNSSKALTAFGGTGSDNMSILGGMAAEGDIDWGTNLGYIYGNVYTEGDFKCMSGGPDIHVGAGESVYIGGDLKLGNDHFKVINETTSPVLVDHKDAPFVLVNGNIEVGGGLNADPFKNVDVITHDFTVNGKYTVDPTTTIYCTSFTSNCGSNSAYNGQIYVDGDVTIVNDNDTKINWTTNPDGTETASVILGGTGTIHFTGNIIDGNDGDHKGQYVTTYAGVGFAQEGAETGGFASTLPDNATVSVSRDYPDGEDNGVIEIKLPGRTNKKQLETHPDNFNNYYVKDENGKLVMPGPLVVPAQHMAAIGMTDESQPFTAASTGITDSLSAKAVRSNTNLYGETFNYVLDTAGGDVKCNWDFDNQKIYIKGGGTVTLLLSQGGGSSGVAHNYTNDNLILVDDDTTLKIVGDTTSGDIAFTKLWVYNQTAWGAYKGQDAGAGTDPLKVGNMSGKGIKVPNIYYYFSGNHNFTVQNDCLLMGYIYAPESNVIISAASTGVPTKGMQYNGSPVTGTPVCIVGSALVKGAKLPNNTGVAYINPDLGSGTPGDPIHSWQSGLYIRA